LGAAATTVESFFTVGEVGLLLQAVKDITVISPMVIFKMLINKLNVIISNIIFSQDTF